MHYNRLVNFISLATLDAESDASRLKRARENSDMFDPLPSPDEPAIQGLIDRCESSLQFQNVARRYDIAVLEFIAGKMRKEILKMESEEKEASPDGALIIVRPRIYNPRAISKDKNIASPVILRIPSNLTVYGLRELLAKLFSRVLHTGREITGSASGESTSEREAAQLGGFDESFGRRELLIMRQVPFTYERKSSSAYRASSTFSKQLGSLDRDGTHDGSRPVTLALPDDDDEQTKVALLVGDRGVVYMEWPEGLVERCVNMSEYEAVDTPESLEAPSSPGRMARAQATTVIDCIDKYCQMEQLEETESWYCNRCKDHVRAWKQIHIYRSPPILIVHLKRFHYSASTHRRDKINLFIDFPLVGLDLTDKVMHWSEGDKPIYDLYAVSNHYGGLGGGHYTAYCLNDDGTWCHYDDSRITNVDPKEVVSQAAYVLYYRRRDVPVGEQFVLNLQTPSIQSPAIIRDPLLKIGEDNPADEISSNAAMVDEDENMEVDDMASRSTSPMASIDGTGDALEHDYDTHSRNNGLLSDDDFPLQ
jgi:hypothetical protein